MKTIYVFGNSLVKEDSLPLKLAVSLREEFPNLDFKEFDTVEDLILERELHILDTVKGIKKVELIEDLDRILIDKAFSLHDFDLSYNLKLFKKMNMIDKVRIFGIPEKISHKRAFEQLKNLIKSDLKRR